MNNADDIVKTIMDKNPPYPNLNKINDFAIYNAELVKKGKKTKDKMLEDMTSVVEKSLSMDMLDEVIENIKEQDIMIEQSLHPQQDKEIVKQSIDIESLDKKITRMAAQHETNLNRNHIVRDDNVR